LINTQLAYKKERANNKNLVCPVWLLTLNTRWNNWCRI